VWYSVLGDLTVLDGEWDRTPTARRVRTVMALLLVNANKFVSPSAFIEELWEDSPPASAAGTLQTYIYQLRRMLASCEHRRDGLDRLVTRPSGYMLKVHPDDLDLTRVDCLLVEAQNALSRDQLVRAVTVLEEAGRLWRGSALADVPCGRRLQATRLRLEELSLTILEQRVDAELRLGEGAALVGELTQLTSLHPFDEGLHARLMRALQQAGRRSDALKVFHRLRQRLVRELGVDPSAEVRDLHQTLLSAHPESALHRRLDPPRLRLRALDG
jgi:DNA-binding SARP family transcriptional activator